jgi:hypothetical protein
MNLVRRGFRQLARILGDDLVNYITQADGSELVCSMGTTRFRNES